MSKIIMLIPLDIEAGLTSVSLGLLRATEQHHMSSAYFRPIAQDSYDVLPENMTSTLLGLNSPARIIESFPFKYLQNAMRNERLNQFMEEAIGRISGNGNTPASDLIIVEGLYPSNNLPNVSQINEMLAETLGADVIFVTSQGNDKIIDVRLRIDCAYSSMHRLKSQLAGVIVNKCILSSNTQQLPDYFNSARPATINIMYEEVVQSLKACSIPIRGCVPKCAELEAFRAVDIARQLGASILNSGDMMSRRIRNIVFCESSVAHIIENYRPGTLLVTTADRLDIITSASLATTIGMELGALLLTDNGNLSADMENLCRKALSDGLPVFSIKNNAWQTAQKLQNMKPGLPIDDAVRIRNTTNYIAGYIDWEWLESLKRAPDKFLPPGPSWFRYRINEMARKMTMRIILPEGEEPRTITAANICAERQLATCILLGNPARIRLVAEQSGVKINKRVIIVDPQNIREKYVMRLVNLRASKGMTEAEARENLMDSIYLATMMLEHGDADGLVSGAEHTTARTLAAPLQIIKPAAGVSLISSLFFMLLPDRVLIYGDCAVNRCPTAEELADIAIQSAQTAEAFGIQPKVAMISYSTGHSGHGSSVEKVREATRIAKLKSPQLVIDGPLQYDAAIVKNVAKAKAPDSPVAGNANILIFPDLNTGNTTYKAVQRSANVVSIGPILQGMRKPVNDLSRGTLIDDIVYTIAITAIQAQQLVKVADKSLSIS